jgi:hypothetical protein
VPTVDEVYREAWGKVGGVGRLRRTFSLFVFMRQMLELQAKNKNPGISGAELVWGTAKRMYCSNEMTQHLLDGVEITSMTIDDFPETIERLLPILNEIGVTPLVSKEDAILSKLLWIQQGSGKSRHDVIEMLKRDEDLDRACLRERAATIGLGELLAEFEKAI